MTAIAESVAKAASDYTGPIRAAVQENVRDVRRAAAVGRHAVEDFADASEATVRRHPFVSLGIAAAIGALAGCVVGFTLRPAATRWFK